MKYVNKKTKAVINTNCVIKGGDWELVKEKEKKMKSHKEEESQNTEEEKGEE